MRLRSFLASITLFLALGFAMVSAGESATTSTAVAGWAGVGGSLGGLIIGVLALCLGLGLAAFAINKGLQVVSKMLGGLDIWAEIKKKNAAVAYFAVGAVIAYTMVIASGIASMTTSVKSMASLNASNWWQGISALVSGSINLIVAIMVASFAISVTFKIMDKLTKDIDEKKELAEGNVAIGIIYGGIMIGVSGLVSAGVSGIGSSINALLNAILGMIF
jgi:uncharacterized membrane protein YjfL (UPF0719 family)